MEIRKLIMVLIISLPFFGLSQKIEDIDYTEYYHVTKFYINTYPEKGTKEDDVIDTIASHIKEGGLFTTNKDVNLNICTLAREWRIRVGIVDTFNTPISDYINNEKSIESLWEFGYTMYNNSKNNFVIRIFDEVENCECSKSIFKEITEDEILTKAMVDPKLKWMTFSYFQHTKDKGLDEEYIFIRWKRKWDFFTRHYMIILEK